MSKSDHQKTARRAHPAANLRLLKDIPVNGGRIIAKPIWRSDNIMFSPDQQLQDMKVQGLTTALDLRAPDEVQIDSSRVLEDHGITHLHRPMTKKAADPETLAITFGAITTPRAVGEWYFRLARARASTLLACLQDISQADGGVVFYCAAGKDRTGVLAASLLLLLGASDDDIVDDYAKTHAVMPEVHARREYATGRPALSRHFPNHPILDAHPDSMQQFLRTVHEAGGIEAVLVAGSQYCGTQADTLEGSDAKIPYSLDEVLLIREQLSASLVR